MRGSCRGIGRIRLLTSRTYKTNMTNSTNKLSKIIEWGVYALVFLLPWQARLIWKMGELAGGFWEYGTFSLYGTELLLGLLVFLNIVRVIREWQGRRKTFFEKLFHCFIVSLFLVCCLSIFWAVDGDLALYKFVVLLEGFMLFWLVLTGGVRKERLLWAIVFSAVIQAGVGSWQFLNQEIVGNKWLGMASQAPWDGGVSVIETGLRRWLRAHGTLMHPNIFGGFLVIGLISCLTLYEGIYRRLSLIWADTNKTNETNITNKFYRIKAVGLLIFFVVMLFGILTSFSRGAWVAVIIVSLFHCFIVFVRRDKIGRVVISKMLIITILVVAMFGLAFKEPFLGRIKGQGRLEAKSVEQRVAGYREGWGVVRDNWLGGVGLGNYTLCLYTNETNVTNVTNREVWDYQPVHNLWLLVLAEIGIFGLLFFAAILLLTIYYSLITKGKSLIFALPLFVIIILSFFDHYFWSFYFGVMVWWMVLGITCKLRE